MTIDPISLGFALVSVGLLYIALRGAPYFPTADREVKVMVRLAEVTPETVMADIGSGDGRILIAFAKAGVKEAHGFEINPFLVWLSRRNIQRAGFADRCFVHQKDLWNVDFRSFDTVVVFGITHIMTKLERKLQEEMRPMSKIISYIFVFPNLVPFARDNGIRCYVLAGKALRRV